ncbi:MAG: HAD family hydrolase [Candidatus Binatia bacterium]
MSDLPELIIFDLGNVIVKIDQLAVAARLARTSEDSRFQDTAVFLPTVRKQSAALLAAFDKGRITPQAFHNEMASTYKLKLDYQEFVQIWNSGFSENHEVSSLVSQLAQHVRLFILSNTNPLHFEYLHSTCPVIKKMEAVILSYQTGYLKPASAIYEHALHLAGLPPERVWYVDDVAEFVDAAVQLGIHAIQFQSASQLSTDLGAVLNGR